MPIATDTHLARVTWNSPDTSKTQSYTCTGSDLVLYVGLRVETTASDIVTGVTYATVAMTRVGFVASTDKGYYLYVLDDPATGANNIVASFSASTGSMVASSYTGVGGVNDNSGTGFGNAVTTVSASATTAANSGGNWAVGIGAASAGAISAGAGTVVLDGDGVDFVQMCETDASIAGSTSKTLTVTASSGQMGIVMCVLSPPSTAVNQNSTLSMMGVGH